MMVFKWEFSFKSEISRQCISMTANAEWRGETQERKREREQLKTERDTKQQKHRHNKEERGYRQADEEVLEIRNR